MFKRFAASASKPASTRTVDLTLTTAFLQAVVDEGLRLSYGALTLTARHYGEDTSGQKAGQRGAKLVKSLPTHLQPHVCRKAGTYAKGVTWDCEVPGDLRTRGVITEDTVHEALEEFDNASED